MHLIGYISLKDLNWKSRPYPAWPAYGQSKLANLLFTSELQRRLEAAGSAVTALSAHPGYSATNLQGHTGGSWATRSMAMGNKLATDADFGARQTLYAVSQDLPGDAFIGPRFAMRGPDRVAPRAARWPATPRRPPASGSYPSSSRAPNSPSDFGLSAVRYPGCESRRGWHGHRYRREPMRRGCALAVPKHDTGAEPNGQEHARTI